MNYIEKEKAQMFLRTECLAKYPASFANGLLAAADQLNKLPTADVVPKSEVERLEFTLLGVMHSVDKWLEGDELERDEVNRAATMREKTLQIIENIKTEVAREIFEEIDSMFIRYTFDDDYISVCMKDEFDDLKKKYTEVGT